MPAKHKGLIIIMDGLGDRPVEQLAYATPLESAYTPNLDQLLDRGQGGQVDPFITGMPVDTHTGVGLLMGLAAHDAYKLERGPIEAAGIGLAMQSGDVLLRCNFATLKKDSQGLEIIDRRAGWIRHGTDLLSQALQDIPVGNGIVASLYPATNHRAVLRLSGAHLCASISDTDPGANMAPNYVLKSRSFAVDEHEQTCAINTANAVNRFVEEAFARLRDHGLNRERELAGLLPVTGILTRGAGTINNFHNLLHHLRIKTAVISGEDTVIGLAKLCHFTAVNQDAFTAMQDTNMTAKVQAVCDALQDHDLVYLHIKGTDTCGHNCDPHGKKEFIEIIDEALPPILRDDLVIGVCADHSTDSTTGRHTGDPVPAIITANHARRDTCIQYGERTVVAGGLGRISANGFVLTILDLMGCLRNYRSDKEIFLRSV